MKQIVLPEIVTIGIYNLQSAMKNKLVSPNRKTTLFELELPLEDGGISYIDDSSHPVRENTVICAKPGQLRHTRSPFKCYYIHMIVSQGPLLEALSSFPNFVELTDAREIRKIFSSLCEYYHGGTAKNELMVQSLLLKLIFLLEQKVALLKTNHRPKPSNQTVIEQTLRYINEHLTEELSLSSLSEQVHFSPIYFHKLFKRSVGKNLREYVEEQRIKKAIDLLISTDKTLTQIAYECGFSSQSHFSCVFKKKMQLPPREYAREYHLKYEKKS